MRLALLFVAVPHVVYALLSAEADEALSAEVELLFHKYGKDEVMVGPREEVTAPMQQ